MVEELIVEERRRGEKNNAEKDFHRGETTNDGKVEKSHTEEERINAEQTEGLHRGENKNAEEVEEEESHTGGNHIRKNHINTEEERIRLQLESFDLITPADAEPQSITKFQPVTKSSILSNNQDSEEEANIVEVHHRQSSQKVKKALPSPIHNMSSEETLTASEGETTVQTALDSMRSNKDTVILMQEKEYDLVAESSPGSWNASIETAAAAVMDAIDEDNGKLERTIGEKTKRNEDSSSEENARKGTVVNSSMVYKHRKELKLDKKSV